MYLSMLDKLLWPSRCEARHLDGHVAKLYLSVRCLAASQHKLHSEAGSVNRLHAMISSMLSCINATHMQ